MVKNTKQNTTIWFD